MANFRTVNIPSQYTARVGGNGRDMKQLVVEANSDFDVARQLVRFGIPYAAAASFEKRPIGDNDPRIKAESLLNNLDPLTGRSLATQATGADQPQHKGTAPGVRRTYRPGGLTLLGGKNPNLGGEQTDFFATGGQQTGTEQGTGGLAPSVGKGPLPGRAMFSISDIDALRAQSETGGAVSDDFLQSIGITPGQGREAWGYSSTPKTGVDAMLGNQLGNAGTTGGPRDLAIREADLPWGENRSGYNPSVNPELQAYREAVARQMRDAGLPQWEIDHALKNAQPPQMLGGEATANQYLGGREQGGVSRPPGLADAGFTPGKGFKNIDEVVGQIDEDKVIMTQRGPNGEEVPMLNPLLEQLLDIAATQNGFVSDQQVATIRSDAAVQIAQFEKNAALQVARERGATEEEVARITTESDQAIANAQSEAQQAVATTQAGGQIGAAEAAATGQVGAAAENAAAAVAVAESNKVAAIESAQARGASAEEVARITADADQVIAEAQTAAQQAIAAEQAAAQQAIATTQAGGQVGAAQAGAAGQVEAAQAAAGGATDVAGIQATAQRDIAEIQSRADLDANQKSVAIASIQAAAQQQIATTQAGGAGAVATTQAGGATDVAGIQAQAQQAIAQIQADVGLDANAKQVAIAQIQAQAQRAIAQAQAQAASPFGFVGQGGDPATAQALIQAQFNPYAQTAQDILGLTQAQFNPYSLTNQQGFSLGQAQAATNPFAASQLGQQQETIDQILRGGLSAEQRLAEIQASQSGQNLANQLAFIGNPSAVGFAQQRGLLDQISDSPEGNIPGSLFGIGSAGAGGAGGQNFDPGASLATTRNLSDEQQGFQLGQAASLGLTPSQVEQQQLALTPQGV